jgi:hypothetical protein
MDFFGSGLPGLCRAWYLVLSVMKGLLYVKMSKQSRVTAQWRPVQENVKIFSHALRKQEFHWTMSEKASRLPRAHFTLVQRPGYEPGCIVIVVDTKSVFEIFRWKKAINREQGLIFATIMITLAFFLLIKISSSFWLASGSALAGTTLGVCRHGLLSVSAMSFFIIHLSLITGKEW